VFTEKPPKTQKLTKMMVATTIVPKMLNSFIISFDLVAKMQTRPPISFLMFLAHQKIKHQVQKKKKSPTNYYENLSKFHTS
jgi:hypothetical protein